MHTELSEVLNWVFHSWSPLIYVISSSLWFWDSLEQSWKIHRILREGRACHCECLPLEELKKQQNNVWKLCTFKINSLFLEGEFRTEWNVRQAASCDHSRALHSTRSSVQHSLRKPYRLKGCLLCKVPASITVTNKTWSEEGIAVSLTQNWFYCNSAIPSVRAKSKVYNSADVTWALGFSFNGPQC